MCLIRTHPRNLIFFFTMSVIKIMTYYKHCKGGYFNSRNNGWTSSADECILSMIFSQIAENHAQNTLIRRRCPTVISRLTMLICHYFDFCNSYQPDSFVAVVNQVRVYPIQLLRISDEWHQQQVIQVPAVETLVPTSKKLQLIFVPSNLTSFTSI